ncbi:MAG: hypothetical protein B6I28_05940 [Fusobacteriia bacterium 4572_132]|nr:MAG: hypothetical protein B6I28_05940 [Fusobacteriia bacterium 4572_132]
MIDLHIHTTCSDGTYTPEEVVELAKEKELDVIAITDHDTIDGVERGALKAKELGIKFINGIELSTNYQGKEIHILGYFLNIEDEKLVNKLYELKNQRLTRTEKIIEKLREFRIEITKEEVMKEVKGDLISRTHIASVLFKKGYVNTRKAAFRRYLGDRGAAYVPRKNFTPMDAVKLLKENGALAFIAHPKLIPWGEKKTFELVDKLKEIGLDGLETYYPSFREIDKIYYKKMCEKRGMIVSGGSDFHGGNRNNITLGIANVKNEVYKKMKERLEEKKIDNEK